jgi:hypothetical protein
VIVAGRNLSHLTRDEIQAYRRTVGFVFQDFKLIPTKTIFENVSFVQRVLGRPVEEQRRNTYQVLKWVGLQHRLNALPQELSGGEQQRVAIARALVNEPHLVLADEPTGNLDPDLSLEIMNLFRDMNARGTTVLVATHDRELIKWVGRPRHSARSRPDGRRRGASSVTVVGYALEEAWLSLRRSGRSALVSIGTIAIAFTTLGGFLLISVNVQDVLDRWLQAAEMSIYLHDTASEPDRLALEQFLRAQPMVAEVEYVSRERALERFRNDFPELRDVTSGIGENPFPSAFEVRLRAGNGGDADADSPVFGGRGEALASAIFDTTAAGLPGWSASSRLHGSPRRSPPAS